MSSDAPSSDSSAATTMRRPPLLFIISAPSGGGKSTVIARLLEADDRLVFSVSSTTRKIREGEKNHVDYHFIGREEFLAKVAAGAFIEHAEVHGNLYGTEWDNVRTAEARGCDLLLDIDVQGGNQIRDLIRAGGVPSDLAGIRPVLVFIRPPTLEVLESRLRRRATDSEEVIVKRLKNAAQEIERGRGYDHVVVNDEVERAVAEIRGVIAEARASVAAREIN